MAVGYSRRIRVQPSPSTSIRSASSSWRCASTPSLIRPGSTPSSCEESCRTSSIVMMSFSPALLTTVQTPSVALLEGAGRGHPVERLVGAVVGVDRQAAVGLDQQQPGGGGEVGGEPARVVDGAAGDDETHGRQRYWTPRRSAIRPGTAGTVRVRPTRPGAEKWPVVRATSWCAQRPTPTVDRPEADARETRLRAPDPVRATPCVHGVTRGVPMSLDVSPALLEQAERGEVDEQEFVDCVRTSLPYAWEMISSLVAQLKVDGGELRRQPGAAAEREGARPAAPRTGERRDTRGAAAALRGAAGLPELPPGGGLPAGPGGRTRATAGSPRSGRKCSTSHRSSGTADRQRLVPRRTSGDGAGTTGRAPATGRAL